MPSLARRLYDRMAVAPNPFRFDPRLDRLVETLCADEQPGFRVLNLGSGSTSYGASVVNQDLFAFRGVHLCGDAHKLPFKDGVFAGMLLRGVLEHVRSADIVVAEARRVLREGAFLYVEVPFLQPYHLSPEDYRRFTLPGLRAFLSDFTEEESGVQIGPGSTLAWVLRETVASVLAFGSPWVYRKILTLVGWTTFWLRYLDRVARPGPFVAHSASAIYYLGRKRGGQAVAPLDVPRAGRSGA
jgi:SAM-dependent methyltransferase